ncbi:MAG: transposase [Bacteroidota bacterium]|nr:transposase [Bacteroidota bacterium]MDP3145761.1 transposase [Bacteroidota bacterium]MDP3556830.1 transposase [Bacteroidota bacterium]
MQIIEPLQYGKFYHIYNRGINGDKLFYDDGNYNYFLKLYETHIDPIADTYSYCLMNNHFHFLIRIKEEDEILTRPIKAPHQYFSNLFNAYTKAINKKYTRNSSLFQRTFKRKLIDRESYFKQVVVYINTNPVHHKACDDPKDYVWSSYLSCISNVPSKIKKNEVIDWFDNIDNFKSVHQQKLNTIEIENYLEL